MAIREVVQTDTPGAVQRRQRLVRVMVTEDQDIYATWQVVLANGRHREITTQVSPELVAQIVSRPAFQTMLQQVADDTFPRIGV